MIIFMFLLCPVVQAIIHDSYCTHHPSSVQCQALANTKSQPESVYCDPLWNKDCKMNDLINKRIASCHLEPTEYIGLMKDFDMDYLEEFIQNEYSRCFPVIHEYVNVYRTRIIDRTAGSTVCVPTVHQKLLLCGEKGTRCVCDTLEPKGDLYNMKNHECRCQWFVDYCSIQNICSATSKCTSGESLTCAGGSINQCEGNPSLCQKNDAYCVELDDKDAAWRTGDEVEGDGFSCINKNIFKQLQLLAPFCDFNRTNHILTEQGFHRPSNNLDYCCYQHLVCIRKDDEIGGYLFRNRPCYCNLQFQKCLQKERKNQKLITYADSLIRIIKQVKICSVNTAGKCNPKNPDTCEKGDLIDSSVAHCKVNCKTGPLLPIEKRSCRTRKCIPPNNSENRRVIDVPYYKESPRCEAVEGLFINCGMEHTRCVCDGMPSTSFFTDGCRCQYWPEL